jgi:hypothetical protein
LGGNLQKASVVFITTTTIGVVIAINLYTCKGETFIFTGYKEKVTGII